MTNYNIISSTDEATVVSEYISDYKKAVHYQSEVELERELIKQLSVQGYEYHCFTSESALIDNLRKQLEMLNDITFTDNEWRAFFDTQLASSNEGIVEKTRKIQENDTALLLIRDDGTKKNVRLLDKKNIHNNRLQVINQYEEGGGTHKARYDVTILVNGLPLVHIELKRRGVAIREAFNQIKRYDRDSFWGGSGLYEYIQIFVISNGTNTKYYSNTTRRSHIKENSESGRRRSKKTSNSFEFTSYWADSNNKVIPDLVDFTKTFFAKHTLLNVLTKYSVFTSEEMLLVMRPYQIAATEKILGRIATSSNYRQTGTIKAGGYIWHTTGSGKTLTSFKTAQLATSLEGIDKVLFVVDRKDLDYQTMKEYDKFQKDAANGSKSTKQLEKNLNDPTAKIIVTTIQKLDIFIGRNKDHDIYRKHTVIIFDECHRSQFGEMHQKIIKAFKRYHLFGFTGTPIFPVNATAGGNLAGRCGQRPLRRTTEQAFGDKLHTYTIVDAINDANVLPFRIDFIDTVRAKDDIQDKKVRAIDIEKAMGAPERVRAVVSYILDHFDQKTYRNQNRSFYTHKVIDNVGDMAVSKLNDVSEIKKVKRVDGFNSIFAVSSIPMAKLYYEEFRKQQDTGATGAGRCGQRPLRERPLWESPLRERPLRERPLRERPLWERPLRERPLWERPLRVATIFSYSANEDDPEDMLSDEDFDNDRLDKSSRDFLESAISDYNKEFGTNYDTSSDSFQSYYKDVSMRVKNREVDLLIVVNMFLTGFDATTLNTLWVDKNLRMHGLIQAFSRTNRILNSIKNFGNIVCFRDLKQATDDAIALFGDKEAGGIVLLKTFDEYYNGFSHAGEYKPGYSELINSLTMQFPLGESIFGENAQKDFIKLYGAILKLRNILTAFDEFEGNEILGARDFQDYQSVYIDLYHIWRPRGDVEKENINDDIVFELELIKQIEVNIDYILMLVEQYNASKREDKTVLVSIQKAIDSSIELRSKKELIEGFISRVNVDGRVDENWQEFVRQRKEEDLSALIADEKLNEDETRRFVEIAFRDGILKTTGTDIDRIIPPVSRFGNSNRAMTKQGIIEKLLVFFEKYFGLV